MTRVPVSECTKKIYKKNGMEFIARKGHSRKSKKNLQKQKVLL